MGDAFRDGVVALIPQLRAYAASIARNRTDAEDLVQETLMRAWKYRSGFLEESNLRAWLFAILRNRLHTRSLAQRQTVADIDGKYAAKLVSAPDQAWCVEFAELMRALGGLSEDTREAIVLVLAAGLTYEEAAMVCGCRLGTMKSRVNRGRQMLADLLDPPSALPLRLPQPRRQADLALTA